VLTAGLPELLQNARRQHQHDPSSNQNNGQEMPETGSNTRFNDYANGYGNALQPDVFHPDYNIREGITYQEYVGRKS
jgi:hypothetical protein